MSPFQKILLQPIEYIDISEIQSLTDILQGLNKNENRKESTNATRRSRHFPNYF